VERYDEFVSKSYVLSKLVVAGEMNEAAGE
jgi:hypothetical protein